MPKTVFKLSDMRPLESSLPVRRSHCCCFTGHRQLSPLRPESAICEDLRHEILQAVDRGYTGFVTGMASGVDLLAGEIVLDMLSERPDLRLIAAVPFPGFELSMRETRWLEKYRRIEDQADCLVYIADHYSKAVFQRRNEWMVNHASLVIAVFDGRPGGTLNTIRYARSLDLPVVYIEG